MYHISLFSVFVFALFYIYETIKIKLKVIIVNKIVLNKIILL